MRASSKAPIPMIAVAIIATATLAGPAVAGSVKAAVFPFELVDTSTEGQIDGVRADQTRRLEATTGQVRDSLAAASVDIVDAGPAKDRLKDVKSLHECLSCAQEAAAALGADFAVVGHVQKVSNLILNINLQIVDVKTGKTVRGGSVDIRGNDDRSWTRGTTYLMKNLILMQPLPEVGAG